jgi:lipoprotein NlpI
LSALRQVLYWVLSRFLRRLADAHRHIGNAYGDVREHRAAVGNYTRAISLDPAYTYAYFSRGVLRWRELRDYEAAIEDLSLVLELDPGWAEAYFNRALAFKTVMRYEEAAADFQRYLEEGTDPFWLDSARRQLDELEEPGQIVEPGNGG